VNAEVEGFAQFVVAREQALQRTAWLLTGDWALAEDLVQTALVRSWPRWERIRRRDDPEIYVRRIMVIRRATARHGTLDQQVRTALMLVAAAADGSRYAVAIISLLALRSGWRPDQAEALLAGHDLTPRHHTPLSPRRPYTHGRRPRSTSCRWTRSG
jgi:DNA-directed RNA polymerase specialized sigma24 family protein